jgi:hypothetical protein
MSAIESSALEKAPTNISSLNQGRLIRQALMINILIFISIIASSYTNSIAIIGGLLIALYLSARSLISPVKAFFLLFGIKLTNDALWFIKIPGFEDYGILHLLLIPIIILVLLGSKMPRNTSRWPIWCAFIYILWVSLSMPMNGISLDFEIILRQAGILIGLLAGYRYLKHSDDFNLLAYFIFISTVLPVLASLTQFFVGTDVSIFHYKLDSFEQYRYSGLYYDAGTTGMVNLLSLCSNLYLLYVGAVRKKYIKYHIAFIPLSLFIILSGGTRSIILTASFILMIFLMRNIRKLKIFLATIPLILIILFIGQPYIDKVVTRTSHDIKRPVEFNEILQETEYRTMFTGRVGLWQDIWEEFKSVSYQQQLFGSGLSSNAHSSYFFLLLQIGWLGLFFYLLFHIFLFMALLYRKIPKIQKLLALLSLASILIVGFSLSTVTYTSFQWIIYLIIGGVLNMELSPQSSEYRT